MQLFSLTHETKGKGRTIQARHALLQPAKATRDASEAQADSLSRFTGAWRRADEQAPPKKARRRGGSLWPPLEEPPEEELVELGEHRAPPSERALSPPSSSERGPWPRSSPSGRHPAR